MLMIHVRLLGATICEESHEGFVLVLWNVRRLGHLCGCTQTYSYRRLVICEIGNTTAMMDSRWVFCLTTSSPPRSTG